MTAPLLLLVGSAFVVSIGEMTCSSRHEAHAVQSRRVGSAAVAENLIALLRIELPKRHATFLRVAGSHRPLVRARPTQWQGRVLPIYAKFVSLEPWEPWVTVLWVGKWECPDLASARGPGSGCW